MVVGWGPVPLAGAEVVPVCCVGGRMMTESPLVMVVAAMEDEATAEVVTLEQVAFARQENWVESG